MQMCDMHPNIIQWASEHEKIKIPYFNPVKNSHSVYIPDFLVVYEDKNGNKKVELVEIKPAAETHLSEAKNSRHKLALAVNAAKWKSALEWCARRNIHFRVLTENEIFRNPKRNNRARVPRNKR